METPQNTEQVASVETPPNLGDVISQAYDEMDAAESQEGDRIEEETQNALGEEEDPQGTQENEEAELQTSEESGDEDSIDEPLVYDEPAPERWPQEWKDQYQAMPDAGKLITLETFKKMQGENTRKTQELAHMRDKIKPMLDDLRENQEIFERAGISPEEAFRRQILWSRHIAQVGPEKGLHDMMQAYGVKSTDETGQQQGEEQPYMTPVEKAMKSRLDQLEGRMTQASQVEENRRLEQARSQQQKQIHSVKGSLQGFMTATDEKSGKLLHPHAERLAPQMAGLIRGNLVPKQDSYGQPVPLSQQLGQAYQMAVNMDPSIRAARPGNSREQMKKVQAANRQVVSKDPAGQVDVQAGPLSDSINDIYDQLERSGKR